MPPSSSDPVRVLVTGMGAPGVRGTLYALRSNPEERKVFVSGTDMNPDAVGRHFADAFHIVPAPESPGYLDRVMEICAQDGIDVVIPQTTRETEFFCRHPRDFGDSGVRVMVPNAEAIAIANNKVRTVELFADLGLPAPSRQVVETPDGLTEACMALGYPEVQVVVKIPVSNGKRGFRIIESDPWTFERFRDEKPNGDSVSLAVFRDMLEAADPFPQLLVTEYLPGPEYSVDAFLNEDVRVALPRRRVAIRSGISFVNEFEQDQDMIEQTFNFAEAAGLEGVFGVQYKRNRKGRPIVLECNPRIQGTMVASLFAGVNLIWMGVQSVLGNPIRFSPDDIDWSTRFVRYWGGVGVSSGVVHEI